MKANAVPMLAVFEKKVRLEVPLYQRQYVWNRENQWEPLWEDIQRKFDEYVEGRRDNPVHFLGAMVLDQKQTPTTHVEKRQVIDGQQRITTLQIFLAAFRDFSRGNGCEEVAKECDNYVLNRGMMADPEVDCYKLWATQADRAQFADVIKAGSPAALELRHPLVRQKWAREPDPRPRMVECYLYFYKEISAYFEALGNRPEGQHAPFAAALDECLQALKNALHVVVIDLDPGDDAQVIFETLNARGEPLLPADLLRNFIFHRALRQDESADDLYEKHWKPFDEEFWRAEIRQGRLIRPRSDLFMQHFLASRRMQDVPVRHLFVEYKNWISRDKPFPTVEAELATLASQGHHFRRLVDPSAGDSLAPFASFLNAFDITTAYPLLLFLLDAKVPAEPFGRMTAALESYFVRRAVCGLTTKNYTRIILAIVRALQKNGPSAENLQQQLLDQKGDSAGWPSDAEFSEAWMTKPAYGTLNNPKLVYVLQRLNQSYLGPKQENLSFNGPLTVEHLLPQDWISAWPLPEGSTGLSIKQLEHRPAEDRRSQATRRRNALLHTFGNLTLLTQPLNASVSNGPWPAKQTSIGQNSLLPLNLPLKQNATWDETTIEARGRDLLERALHLWPRSV